MNFTYFSIHTTNADQDDEDDDDDDYDVVVVVVPAAGNRVGGSPTSATVVIYTQAHTRTHPCMAAGG